MARVTRVGAGAVLLVAGVAMLLLPGPGLLTIAAALGVLQRDIPAARRLVDRFRDKGAPRRCSSCPEPSRAAA